MCRALTIAPHALDQLTERQPGWKNVPACTHWQLGWRLRIRIMGKYGRMLAQGLPSESHDCPAGDATGSSGAGFSVRLAAGISARSRGCLGHLTRAFGRQVLGLPVVAPNLGGRFPTLRDAAPNLGGTFPTLRDAAPNLGGRFPTLRDAAPNLGGRFPTLRNAAPNLGGRFPTLRNAAPNLGGTFPTLRDAAPNLGGRFPTLRNAAPNLGGRFPRLRDAAPNLGGTFPTLRRAAWKVAHSLPRVVPQRFAFHRAGNGRRKLSRHAGPSGSTRGASWLLSSRAAPGSGSTPLPEQADRHRKKQPAKLMNAPAERMHRVV